MNAKQIIGLFLFALGLGMLFGSHYIAQQVLEGKAKIASAQSKVDTSNKLFSVTPVTKPVGKTLTGSAQSQIDAGRGEVSYYEQVVQWLQIGGAAFVVIGIGACLFCRTRRSR